MELKIVISDPKTGKSIQRELKDDTAKSLKGMRIGQTFKGESIDLSGFEFKITGGSDSAGFPMRKDIPGAGRGKVLAVKGVGLSNKKNYRKKAKKGLRTMDGMRQRKTVAGNTIGLKTAQVNLMITKAGKENLFAEAPAPEGEAKAEGKKAETKEAKPEEKKEEKKESPKAGAKPEAKEESKAEEKKEAPAEKPKEDKPEEKKEEPKADKKEEAPKEEKAEKPVVEKKE